jgi:hypothetical protein
MKTELAVDENGAPMLLRAGSSGTSVVVPTKSGNAKHDTGTGVFGKGSTKPGEEKDQPQVDPSAGSVQRRRDAVVDAARELDDLSAAGVEQFVRRRWRGDRPITQEDIEAFAADARRQRVHDITDALDFRIRKAVQGRVGSRLPHVSIPRGLQRKSLAGLDREELMMVFTRLRERGWSNQQIKRHGVRRVDTDKRAQGLLDS